MRETVGSVLDRNKGIGPGFDWCRLGLSLFVVLLHSFHSSYGVEQSHFLATGPFGPFFASILPMFFGLSGFLVTGSALRLRNTQTFLVFRVLRIAPALMVEVTLSALILGPLLTAAPLSEYFSSPEFFSYFQNVLGRIHYYLPGMFLNNPSPGTVNVNLWTLQPEFVCYVVMAALMISSIAYRRNIMTAVWIVATIVMAIYNWKTSHYELNGVFGREMMVYYFVTGSVAFHWRHYIPVNGLLFAGSLVAAYILLKLPQTALLCPAAIMYAIVWLGLQRFPRFALIQSGDYSYGVYLYGYPIQQTFVHLFPEWRIWWIVLPVSITLTFLFAAFSWHLIEKNALRLKKFLLQSPPQRAPKVSDPAVVTS